MFHTQKGMIFMAGISYLKDREDMCKVAHYMWDRRLTNAAGGNFCRAGR